MSSSSARPAASDESLLPHEVNLATAMLDLPVILPQELDELLDDNDALLAAAVQCQEVGRLEDSLIYLNKLQENITSLGRHCEIYRSQHPFPDDDEGDIDEQMYPQSSPMPTPASSGASSFSSQAPAPAVPPAPAVAAAAAEGSGAGQGRKSKASLVLPAPTISTAPGPEVEVSPVPPARVRVSPIAAHYITLQKERARAFVALGEAFVTSVPAPDQGEDMRHSNAET